MNADGQFELFLDDAGRRAREAPSPSPPSFVPPVRASPEPDDEALAAPWDDPALLAGPSAVAALAARVRAIAFTAPLHALEANKVRFGGEAWSRLNLLELAFHAIDVVALRMDFDTGATYDDAVVAVAALARLQAPDLADPERVGERVVEGLISGRSGTDDSAHSASYGGWGPDGYVSRRYDYALLTDHVDADGEFYLRVTDPAITVLIGALELDVESAQVAAELRLRELVKRGLLTAALREAENARYRSIRYMEQLRRQLAAARLSTTEPGVLASVDELVDDALDHVLARYKAERSILANVAKTRDAAADDLVGVRKANELIDRLSDCQRRHQALHARLIRARGEFRDAHAASLAVPPTSASRVDLERQLLRPMLEATLRSTDVVAGLLLRLSAAPGAPPLADLEQLTAALCLPVTGPADLGVVVDLDVELVEMDPEERFNDGAWDLTDSLLADVDAPTRLSALVDRAAALELDDDARNAAATLLVLRAAHAHDPQLSDRARRRDTTPFLVALSDGASFGADAVAGDDLLLVPARLGAEEPADG